VKNIQLLQQDIKPTKKLWYENCSGYWRSGTVPKKISKNGNGVPGGCRFLNRF
jgi:hypothetical protein